MNSDGKTELLELCEEAFRDGLTKGEARGRRRALQGVVVRLALARDWELTPSQLVQLAETEDAHLLERWCLRTITGTSLDEVLSD